MKMSTGGIFMLQYQHYQGNLENTGFRTQIKKIEISRNRILKIQ